MEKEYLYYFFDGVVFRFVLRASMSSVVLLGFANRICGGMRDVRDAGMWPSLVDSDISIDAEWEMVLCAAGNVLAVRSSGGGGSALFLDGVDGDEEIFATDTSEGGGGKSDFAFFTYEFLKWKKGQKSVSVGNKNNY